MDDSFYQGGNDNYYDESRDNSIAKEKEEDEDEEANYFSSLPVGYKFRPTDEELITHYLSKKVMNHTLPKNKINDVRLYKYSPKELADLYKQYAKNEKFLYFFTPRDRKYKMGRRPNRVAGNGYWKATGKDVKIQQNDLTIGYRKTLVYYEKQASRGVKTNWIMHEYRIDETPDINLSTSTDMKLDDCVLCRIHYKPPKISSDPPSETNPSATTSLPPKPTITKRRIRSALPSLTEASSHSALSSSKATNPIGHAQTTPESSVEYISASNSMAINNLPSMSNYPSHMHYPVTTNQVLNNSYSHVNFTGSGNGFQYVDPLYTQPPQEFYDGNYSSLETVPFGSTNPNFYPSAFDGTNQNFHPETSGTNQHLYVPNQQDSAMGDSYFEKLGIHFDEFGNAYDQYNGAHPMNTHYQKP